MINYQLLLLLLILTVQKSKSARPKPGRIDIFSSGHVHSIFGVSLDLLGGLSTYIINRHVDKNVESCTLYCHV